MATAQISTTPATTGFGKNSRERRLARRFDLRLPLVLLPFADFKSFDGKSDLPTGKTRDISTKGIYFTTEVALAPGAEFAFTTMLSSELTHGRKVFVCGQGKAVRMDPQKPNGTAHYGVAAVINRFEIVKEDPLYAEVFGAQTATARPVASVSA